MRISDWSSDVCSSDLAGRLSVAGAHRRRAGHRGLALLAPARRAAAAGRAAAGRAVRRQGRVERARPPAPSQPGRNAPPQAPPGGNAARLQRRSEEHTSELQSLMRISYAVFCLTKKNTHTTTNK